MGEWAEMAPGEGDVAFEDWSEVCTLADLLVAAIPGIAKDQGFDFWIENEGDSALTVAVGTGITLKVLTGSVDGIMTVAM